MKVKNLNDTSSSNATQVFSGTDYKNLTSDNLFFLLNMDELDTREIVLFQALLTYVKIFFYFIILMVIGN